MQHVCIIPGDDAAPEAVLPSIDVLRALELDLEFNVLPGGAEGTEQYGRKEFARIAQEAIDAADTTLYGSTSGTSPGLGYLRWGKGTFANVRPIRYLPGANSPLAQPEGIDFIIVRENMEDMYVGVEGDVEALAPLNLVNRLTRKPIDTTNGRFAIKIITEANSRRVLEFGFELARKRKAEGHPGKLTASCKHNMLPHTDGLFREVAYDVARQNPDIEFDEYIVDDFARRIVAEPHQLDVVVLPNLYGDILSDEASGLIGGLGLAPSACYSDDFAYFEPVHGTAPDIAGQHIINPTATLLSSAMMLDWLGHADAAKRLEAAVEAVYREGVTLTPDQGGSASSDEFCQAVAKHL
jgi:isocitrate/isopropylmalate dehydrogenase